MYRKFSAVLFLLLFAQTAQASEIKVLVGMNFSKYLFTDTSSSLKSQQKTGTTFGLGWAFNLDSNIKLELNALYSQGGAKASIAYTPDLSLSGLYKNTSFALPILIKYDFKTWATPYIAVGPEIVFLLSHHLLLTDSEDDFDLRDNTKKFILAVTAIFGYELPFREWSLIAEIRYRRWLSNFLVDPEIKAKSQSFAFLLGGVYYL
jgi:opacity protein-like surface antigen